MRDGESILLLADHGTQMESARRRWLRGQLQIPALAENKKEE